MKKLLGRYSVFLLISFYLGADTLVDAKDSYPTSAVDWDSLYSFFIGFLFVLAGFLFSLFNPLKYIKKDKISQNYLLKKIEETKDEKELLRVLLSQDKKYNDIVKQLEESIYGDKKMDFMDIKAKLSKL